MSWAVVYTKPRQEIRAKENLESMGLEVSYPLRPVEKVQQGVISINFECLFPRYIFVRNEGVVFPRILHTLRNVRGVSQVVKFGGQLAELDDLTFNKIDNFQRVMSSRPARLYQPGEEVVFTHGAFRGIQAIYKESDGNKRVVLLFDLFSKPTKLSVPLTAVSRS